MKRILLSPLVILILLISFSSCNKNKNRRVEPEITFSISPSDSTTDDIPDEKREIFYGLLTPVEISAIFNRLGATYTPELLNDNNRGNDYLSSSKAALNLGVYGVDLSYLKMFNLHAEMIKYMIAVRSLSDKLGIPIDFLTGPIEHLENDMNDADSILNYVNTAYKRIEDHLKIDNRESTAGLMVLGGWIEALYIACELIDESKNLDPEVVARVAEQKYTLNTLLSFLKNYYDDPVVVYYTKKLKFLKKYFDKFEIYFDKTDLEIDEESQVLKASRSEMTITRQNLKDIKDYVEKMREETVGI
ncbi:MAG: hypothetical protein V2I37_11890 [Marinilabiliaceae bacterium]|jgi:hypothetical protein|nr:hypothetical protein [Marinilabiliaceae bacterium]